MQPDKSVLQRIREGDRGALAALYDLFHLELLAYCRRILGNSQDAEDVVQDVFAKLQSDIKSLRDDALFRNWLFRIARNDALMKIRGRRSDGDIDSDTVWMVETPHDLVEQGEITLVVQKLLDELKPDYRQVLILREYDGMSYTDIAEALDLSVDIVKVRVYRARSSMTEKLKNYYG